MLFKNTAYGIADVFASNPYPNVINGSIWTLKHQFFMYLIIIPIYHFFIKDEKKNKKFLYLFIILLFMVSVSYSGYYDNLLGAISSKFGSIGILAESKQLVRLLYYFCAGIILNIYSEHITYSKGSLITSLIIILITFKTRIFTYACLLLIPYLTIFIGSIKTKIKLKDYSYQIFIWGFPIQQLIMYYLNGKINIYIYIILSVIITIIVSFITYYITEQLLMVRKSKKC